MKVVLFLLGIAAAIYAFLVLSNDALTGDKAARYASQAQPNQRVDAHLNSWGTYLPDPSSPKVQAGTPRQAASLAHPQPKAPSPNAGGKPGAAYQAALSEERAKAAGEDGPKPAPVEWVKVMLDADAHSEASISSPSVRSYAPGTELQVVKREGAWSEVSDPSTQQRSWILEKFLSSSSDPGSAQVAAETPAEPVAEPPTQKPAKRHRSAKSVDRVSEVNADPWSGRWARRAHRQRRFGLFMFHPLGRGM
jgi:hypothetical protein